MDFDLTHARHDPAHCLTPGLFRSLKRGERKTEKLDVTYHYGKDERVRFIGFEPLGGEDMRLLQGLVALGGPDGIILTPNPTAEMPKRLRSFLAPKFDATEQNALVVRGSIRKLLTEVGLSRGGENIKAVKDSLIRMSNVTVIVYQGTRQASFHLMSHAFDEADGSLFVCLNPRITQVILGHRPHARIAMGEVRGLTTTPARLIHQRLCGWIDPAGSGRVTLDTLCSYVWPTEAKPEAMKKRRQTAKKALDELVAVGWSVERYASKKYQLTRPKAQS